MKFFVDFEASMENECIISIGAISEEGHEFSTLVKPSKEGEKIGERKKAIETAKKLLQNKIPLEIILESTGISNETLQFLIKEMDENTY